MSYANERCYSVKDLIDILEVPKVTILSWIHNDQLAASLRDPDEGGNAKYMIAESDLMDLLYDYKKRLPNSARVDETIFRFIAHRIRESRDAIRKTISHTRIDLVEPLESLADLQFLLEDILEYGSKPISKSSDENRA